MKCVSLKGTLAIQHSCFNLHWDLKADEFIASLVCELPPVFKNIVSFSALHTKANLLIIMIMIIIMMMMSLA